MSSTVASPLRTDFERRPARSSASTSAPEIIRVLGSIMAVVLVAYLIIGLAMPVLPLYVHQELGLSTFMVASRRESSSRRPSFRDSGQAATQTRAAPSVRSSSG
jgi:hypothetical protein